MRGWKPADTIAVILIVSIVLLKLKGYDSAISYSLLAVVTFYYGIDLKPWTYIKRRKRGE